MAARPILKTRTIVTTTALAIGTLFVMAIVSTAQSSKREQESNNSVLQARNVSDILNDTLAHVEDAETGQRGYLLTGSPLYLAPFAQGCRLAPSDLDRLQSLTQNSPSQQQHIAHLRPLVTSKLAELQKTVDLYRTGQKQRALEIVDLGYGQHLMESIRSEVSQMRAIQSQIVLRRMAKATRNARQTFLWVTGELSLAVVLLIWAAWRVASLMALQAQAEKQLQEDAVLLEAQKQELERANTELEALATTDGLTGLKNHRAFQERLVEEVSRARRYGTQLSLVMLDVDRFKHYNDTYGHPIGDVVLKAIAGVLLSCVRDTDTVARYGGEEFILLLSQTDLEGAVASCERIRFCMEQHEWPMENVTASFGVAALQLSDTGGADLIVRADMALYQSKASGRNRVTSAA